MANRHQNSICGVLAVVIAALNVCGCVKPAHFGRCHVTAELEQRIGQAIGPALPVEEVAVPDAVFLEDGLSEDEAVSLGLWNNPTYQELLADLNITQAECIQARQLANPELTTMFPLSAKQWELTLMVPLDVLLLRPKREAAALVQSQRVAQRLVQDGLNVVRDIRWAYTDLVLAQQRYKLAQEGASLYRKLVQIAEARLKAGALSELDVSAMRLQAMQSEEQRTVASHDVDLARQNLRFLLGATLTEIDCATVELPSPPKQEFDDEALLAEALACRPDLQAQGLAITAACERERLAHYDYLGVFGALPDINAKGDKGFEAGPGLKFTVPIFNQNQGAIAKARAEAELLEKQYATMENRVALELRQAHTRLQKAKQELETWRDQITPQAVTASVAAENALKEDGVSLLLVLETTRQRLDAQRRELEAAADVHRAMAELERCVGRRLVADSNPAAQVDEELPPPEPIITVDEELPPPEPIVTVEEAAP